MDLKNINNPGHWHIAMVASGAAIGIAALAASTKPAFLIGLGILLFGLGEMRNHPYQEYLAHDDFGRPTAKVSGHPRRASVLGLALDATGVVVFFGGLGWYVFG